MSAKAVLLIGGGLSLASGIWAANAVNDFNHEQGIETARKLEDCAVNGLDYDGCRVLVESHVTPDIVTNSLGHTAVFTDEVIIESAQALEVNSALPDGNLAGVFVAGAGSLVTALIATSSYAKSRSKDEII